MMSAKADRITSVNGILFPTSLIMEAGVAASRKRRRPDAIKPQTAASDLAAGFDEDGITVVRETITPEIAAAYLEKNTSNRAIRPHLVARYANDIRGGRWQFTHQGVAFFDDGGLMDGQHRLTAIVRTGIAVRAWVFRGYPRIAAAGVDTNAVRTELDISGFLGLGMTRHHIACAKGMLVARYSSEISRQYILAFTERHREAIEFAVTEISNGECRNSIMHGVVARAYDHAPHAALKRFCELLVVGAGASPKELAAMKIRDYLMKTDGCLGSKKARYSTYLRCENALACFLRGRVSESTREAAGELFPIDEDEKPLTWAD